MSRSAPASSPAWRAPAGLVVDVVLVGAPASALTSSTPGIDVERVSIPTRSANAVLVSTSKWSAWGFSAMMASPRPRPPPAPGGKRRHRPRAPALRRVHQDLVDGRSAAMPRPFDSTTASAPRPDEAADRRRRRRRSSAVGSSPTSSAAITSRSWSSTSASAARYRLRRRPRSRRAR